MRTGWPERPTGSHPCLPVEKVPWASRGKPVQCSDATLNGEGGRHPNLLEAPPPCRRRRAGLPSSDRRTVPDCWQPGRWHHVGTHPAQKWPWGQCEANISKSFIISTTLKKNQSHIITLLISIYSFHSLVKLTVEFRLRSFVSNSSEVPEIL